MSDFKERLEQERRRYAMSGDSFGDLERRRDRKRRNRRLGSGLVALAIAAAGIGAGLYAFRPTGQGKPADSPTPSIQPSVTAPEPSPSSTPTGVPPVEAAVAPAISGAIQFVDAEHGWMVDGGGQILVTTDGGRSWMVQLSGPSSVTAIDMLSDGMHGWGVFDGGLVQTGDGGEHWVTWSNQPLSSIQFITPEIGWGVAPDGSTNQLMTTTDGGRSWAAAAASFSVGSVCFANEEQGWAAGLDQGGDPTFYRTDDGGATWSTSRMPVPAGEWGAEDPSVRCAPDGSDAFATVFGGAAAGSVAYAGVEATSDAGSIDQHVVFVSGLASGQFHPEGASVVDDPYPGVFAVVDRGVASFINWCPACDGRTFVTRTQGEPAAVTDRIELPKPENSGGPEEPLGVSFIDADRGWTLLQVPAPKGLQPVMLVLHTEDGGATWTAVCDASSAGCFGTQSVP